MLADLWPLFGLTVVTPRLRLCLPHEEELAALADLAGRGVHPPGERPFLTPWTDGTPADRARAVLRGHWHQLAAWDAAAWELGRANSGMSTTASPSTPAREKPWSPIGCA